MVVEVVNLTANFNLYNYSNPYNHYNRPPKQIPIKNLQLYKHLYKLHNEFL